MTKSKWSLALLFISISSFGAEPKFHFQDCVKVVSGFYRNCYGNIRAVSNISAFPRDNMAYNIYDVALTCENEGILAMLKENELEMIDRRKCDAH